MSRIDLHNYEAFLLDYAEGNLSPEDTLELRAFAVLHPELNIDLDNLSLPYFSEEETFFDFKKELRKSEDEVGAFDQRIISYLEGLLNEQENAAFEKELKGNPALAAEFSAYSKTKLKADPTEQFPVKEELLKLEELLNTPALLYTEGLLKGAEKEAFEQKVISDKTLAADVQAYANTKSAADASIIYPDKEELKKKTRVIALFSTRSVVSMAAAVLLIIGIASLFNYLSPTETTIHHETAGHDKDSAERLIKNKIVAPEKQMEQSIDLSEKENKTIATNSSVNSIQKRESTHPSVEKNPVPKIQEKPVIPGNEMADQKELVPTNPENPAKQNDLLANATPKEEVKKAEPVKMTRFTELAYEDDVQDEVVEASPEKNNFWKRAVKVAQGVNVLGFKAVSGEEKSKDNYVLSFNSVSIEKK